MSHMLSCDVDGHLNVKLEFDHFERSRVPVAKEVSYETPVSSCGLSPISIRDSGCLYDRRIQIFLRHVINEPNKSMIQNFFHYKYLSVYFFIYHKENYIEIMRL
jgi:hypothetical protein